MKIIHRWIALLCFPIMISCSIKQPALDVEHWRVMPDRDTAQRTTHIKYWLTQGTITVVSPFDTKSFVYRLDDQKYEKDFYNEYVTIPSDMFGVATRQWLNEAGIFQFAVGNANALMPLYLLQGTVEEFYTDFRKGRPTLTVLTIEYYLSSTDGIRKNNVLFKKKYSVSEPIKDNSAKSIANAQQVAFGKILAQLEEDLAREALRFPKP